MVLFNNVQTPGETQVYDGMFVEHHSIGIGVSTKGIAVVGMQPDAIVTQGEELYASSNTCHLRTRQHGVVSRVRRMVDVIGGLGEELQLRQWLHVQLSHDGTVAEEKGVSTRSTVHIVEFEAHLVREA